jgi:hypothetical protein
LQFADIINKAYDRLETNNGKEGTLVLDTPQLESWLISRFQELGFSIDTHADFFASGIDSLKAMQMRAIIIKGLDLGGHGSSLASMAIYESGNVERLATKLTNLRLEIQNGDDQDEIPLIEQLIEQYSALPEFVPGPHDAGRQAVVVSLHFPLYFVYLTIIGPHGSNWVPRSSYTRGTDIKSSCFQSHMSTAHIFPVAN